MPEESVDMVMFSPPFWGLRDYKIPKVDDVFAVGGLGLESHPKQYIQRMVVLCRLLRRVLKKSGSLWINLGDTYYGGAGSKAHGEKQGYLGESYPIAKKNPNRIVHVSNWLQPKQKLLIPERTAIALQEDGWVLRNDIIWHKPNAMPSSVKDRLTQTYEHIFHFVKNRKYYYNLDAIREPHTSLKDLGRKRLDTKTPKHDLAVKIGAGNIGPSGYPVQHPLGKNPGDIVEDFSVILDEVMKIYSEITDIEVQEWEGKAYALDPQHNFRRLALNERKSRVRFEIALDKLGVQGDLRRKLIAYWHNHLTHPLGKNPGDTIKIGMHHGSSLTSGRATHYDGQSIESHPLGSNLGDFWSINTKPFKGAHFAIYPEQICIKPILSSCPSNGIVLDPMCGSGTTLAVAKKLGRNYIGIELNPSYVAMARKRLSQIPEKLEKYMAPNELLKRVKFDNKEK